ncbi:MAG: fatty acid desaturase [Xanthomonadales bacterium]|nr:fatty acid desaturase [Xanthomonadales bacterium]
MSIAGNEAAKQHVQVAVQTAEQSLRARHPWLNRQDLIGASILVGSLLAMLGCAWAYAEGWMPAWLCIPLVAVFASFTHEIEHDLIHWMYFRKRPWAHHLMMMLAWIARPSTINPWIRRHLHFHHHKHSGTASDVEERSITNGEPWGPIRVLMLADAGFSTLVRAARAPDWRRRWRALWRSALAYFPLGWLHWGLWWAWLATWALDAALDGSWSSANWQAFRPTLDFLVVVWIAPNVLRSFCLHAVSSNMHYFGDVEDGNLVQQTQVLTVWWLWPLQLFCFNFGGTHAIHHFVVKQPFYLRQWTARPALRALREVGVRFDDFSSLRRANRWGPTVGARPGSAVAAASAGHPPGSAQTR